MLPKLLDIVEGVASGMFPDKHPSTQFLWSTGKNVRFTLNGVEKRTGFDSIFTKPASNPVRGMLQLLDTSSQKIFWGDADALYMWDTTSVSTVNTGYSGTVDATSQLPATAWSMVEWGNWSIASNGVDQIQIRKGTGTFANLTGTPPATAEIILKVQEHLLAINVAGDTVGYAFCDTDDPEDWVPTASNRAGSNTIRDLSSAIVAAVPLTGNTVAVYARTEMALINYIGEPLIFGHKKGPKGPGALSKQAVVQVGNENYGMSPDGFFRTNGVTFEWIGEAEVKDTVYGELKLDHTTKVCAYHDAEHSEVVWFYPTVATEPDKGVIYNYDTKRWSFTGYGRTSALERLTFDYPLSAASDGNVYYEDFAYDADSTAMLACIESKPMSFEAAQAGMVPQSLADFWKYIDAIKLAIKGEAGNGLEISIGVQETLQDEVLWTDYFYADSNMNVIYPEISGRWITIRVQSEALGSIWQLQGMTIYGTLTGEVAS